MTSERAWARTVGLPEFRLDLPGALVEPHPNGAVPVNLVITIPVEGEGEQNRNYMEGEVGCKIKIMNSDWYYQVF